MLILTPVIFLDFDEQVDKRNLLDLKLQTLNDFFLFLKFINFSTFSFFNFLDPLYLQSFQSLNVHFAQNVSFFFALKFLLAISFLILIRGGTPRYRYDYLTKLG